MANKIVSLNLSETDYATLADAINEAIDAQTMYLDLGIDSMGSDDELMHRRAMFQDLFETLCGPFRKGPKYE